MVLEHLFPENWLERKVGFAFLLALVYSTVAIIAANLLFGANAGLVAVVFTSLLLLPYMQKLFEKEEMAELREKGGFKLHRFLVDNWPAIKVYAAIFFGIYLAFMLYSFFLPMFGVDTGIVFREQLSLEGGIRGNAFSAATFLEIFLNNWWVLLACFLLALVTGDGAIFFITWNASTWGAIFGFRAIAAADGAYGPFLNLLLIALITLPHVILEGGAYILAAIAGSVISDDVVSETKDMPVFLLYLVGAVLVYLVAVFLFHWLIPVVWLRGFLNIGVVVGLIALLAHAFEEPAHKRVFWYNHRLFIVAIVLFLVGALVETFVLGTSDPLFTINMAALAF